MEDEATWLATLRPSRAVVAPDGAPFGCASFFAPVFLFYELTEQRSLEEAVQRLAAHDRELGTWRLHAWIRVRATALLGEDHRRA